MTAPVFDQNFRRNLDDLFHWRRDVRHFRQSPVPEADLDALLALTACAPSVGLSQPWRFVRVETPEKRAQVRKEFTHCNAEALAARRDDDSTRYAHLKLAGLDDAPHHIAVFCERDPHQGRGLGRLTMPETVHWSAVMAIHTFWLAAQARGIGVGWVSIVRPDVMYQVLDAEPSWDFMAYLCVGYPGTAAETPELEQRGWEHRNPARTLWIRR